MKNFLKIIPVVLIILVVSSLRSFAQSPFEKKVTKDSLERRADSLQAELARSRAKVKPYKDVVTKDFVTMRGLFTIHKNKKTKQWLWEIPDSLLNRDILAVTRIAAMPGGLSPLPGEEQDQRAIRFEFGPDSILDMKNDLVVMHADSGSRISKAVAKADGNPILTSFLVLAYGPGKKSVVIDASKFMADAPYSFMNAISKGSRLDQVMMLSSPDVRVLYTHVYPQNVDIRLRKQGKLKGLLGVSTETLTIETVTSFVALPRTPMVPRYIDPRVGFFNGYYLAFSDDQQGAERKFFTTRFRLEPKAKDLKKWKNGSLVEPQKPIVIYLDPATPKQWRPYLIAGINDWQKAFEKAGFKHAIIGKEWPENDTTMHTDDARYSMINYLPSKEENAYGPQTLDPRTGEVINTRIGWFHNVMTLLHDWYITQAGANDTAARHVKFDDKLMGQLIRFVSSHEVGHTLGLMHNFLASSFTPVDSLRSQHYLEKHGHTISIMDYARFNYVAQPEDHIKQEQLWPHIGEYDQWAIQWGYGPTKAADPDAARLELSKLTTARLTKDPRLQWIDAQSTAEGVQDPRATSEDLGDDAVKASTYGIKNLKRVAAHLPEWTYKEAGNYKELYSAYSELATEYMRFMIHVVRNVNGSYFTPKTDDQPGSVFAPVPKIKQLEALAFLDKELFTTPTWLMDEHITAKILRASGPNFLEGIQTKALNTLLDGKLLNNKIAQAASFGNKALPVREYLDAVHQLIWKDVLAGSAVPDRYRRNLQRSYVACLDYILAEQTAEDEWSERNALIRGEVRRLQAEIEKAITVTKDKLTLSHLHDLEYRLDAILKNKDLNPA